MKKYLSIGKAVIVFFMLVSCTVKVIPDPIDPRLPKYTESGNNTAGAFVNDEVWESVVRTRPSIYGMPTIYADSVEDNVLIRFEGNLSGKYCLVEFYLSDLDIRNIEDLAQLHNKKILLDGENNFAMLHTDFYSVYSFVKMQGGSGQLYIKKVSLNAAKNSAILSGTFGFTYQNPDGEFYEVSYGRFDYKFSTISVLYFNDSI